MTLTLPRTMWRSFGSEYRRTVNCRLDFELPKSRKNVAKSKLEDCLQLRGKKRWNLFVLT